MLANEFENHPVFLKLEQLSLRFKEGEVTQKISIDKLSYFISVCDYISQRLNLTIPVLVNVAELNALAKEIEGSLIQFNTFLGNNNLGNITNAENILNAAVARVKSFPLQVDSGNYSFSKKVSNFEKTVKAKYEILEVNNEALWVEFENLKKEIESKQNEIQKLSEIIVLKTNEINNLTNKFQTEFSVLKTTSIQNVENDRKSFRTEISQDKLIYKEEFEKEKRKFNKEIGEKMLAIDLNTSDVLQSLNKKLDEAKKIVNVIGNIGVTGDYMKIANYHKKTADTWRYVAVCFMTVMSVLLIITIWDLKIGNIEWEKSIIRIVAVAILSYPATYAARESSKHRKLENKNRRTELELATLNPYIELLPEEKKREIKEKLVEKYFGNQEDLSESNKKEEDLSLNGFEKILKAIIPFVKKQ